MVRSILSHFALFILILYLTQRDVLYQDEDIITHILKEAAISTHTLWKLPCIKNITSFGTYGNVSIIELLVPDGLPTKRKIPPKHLTSRSWIFWRDSSILWYF
jgi:hypothetical protein